MPNSVENNSILSPSYFPNLASQQLYCARHLAMATEYSLYVFADSPAQVDEIAESVFEEIDRVEDLLSNYRQSSELCRINREAADADVTTDPETFHFLETAFAWSARSQGAFDITVGKLMKAWGFFRANGAVPPAEELALANGQIGWQKVHMDSSRRTVRFLSPEIELDPGGIGKGYAVDRAVRILRAQNVPAALLSAGSSTIYALGAPPGEPGWKIRVPSPHQEQTTISTPILRNTSLSTANRSEKHFIKDGHLYGAIMDPRTLHPVEGMLQTSAVSPLAIDSDALSNALFVAGAEARASLLGGLPHCSALVVSGDPSSAQYEATRWPAELTIPRSET